MSWPLYQGEDILELLPQREPFLMVDVLYGSTVAECRTGFNICPGNIFCDGTIFSAEGVIEHMAQSCSVLLGYNAVGNSSPVPVGYIGEIKQFRLYLHPRCGQSLSTSVSMDKELGGIRLMSARTRVKNCLIGECRMKLSV
jgi:hypothetical protein